MELLKVLNHENIIISSSSTKHSIISELVNVLFQNKLIENEAELLEKVLYRESLMSTGIGLGIAIPHVRYSGVDKPVIAIGVNPGGIEDYEALDNEQVKIVILIVAGKEQHRMYIQLMSQIMKVLKKDNIIQRITECKEPSEIIEIFRTA